MSSQLALTAEGLHKTFRVPRHRVSTLKEQALHPFRRTEFLEYHVLRGLDFEVAQGEFFGIVGRNGTGKSTLLKCVAGIYRADQGTIRLRGRLAPFIELGVGFNPDLTARENVMINAVMMGLSTREARRRFDRVIDFAELGDFLDLKLKNYSSGMQVRLAFSVMVESDADVMLIDEVLAVGDASFQQKCLDVFYDLRRRGRTIVLVTHDMSMVERFCHRAMLVQNGVATLTGEPNLVAMGYLDANFGRSEPNADPGHAFAAVKLVDAWIENGAGTRVGDLRSGEQFSSTFLIEATQRIEAPKLTLVLTNEADVPVTGASTDFDAAPLLAGERATIRTSFDVVLNDGRHYLDFRMTRGTAGTDVIAEAPHAIDFVVHSAADVVGLVNVTRDMTVQRQPAEPQ